MSVATCSHGSVLTSTQVQLEASRCLMCDEPPCEAACPARVPVKHFIRALRFETPRRAINLIRDRNVLAGVCGLACPVERLCVGACRSTDLTTPIAIGRLQHYAAEVALHRAGEPVRSPRRGQRVAVVGGGPSGLAAAAELARRGHRPTIFERNPRLGGVCTYGVPGHRIPQELVAAEIAWIRGLGVEVRTGWSFGPDQGVDQLFAAGFRAVYVAVGLQQASRPALPGAEALGVSTWKEVLDACSRYHLGEGQPPAVAKHVIVIGGGGVAMDVAGAAQRLGAAEIDIVCLEAPREMPADRDELKEVWEQGARFHTRSMPLEITHEKRRATGLRAVRIRWKQPGLLVPANAEPIAGTEYWLPGEMVVFATGARPAPELAAALAGVDVDAGGRILVDPQTGATSRPGVFAGGDVVAGGGTTIVNAVAEGKRAGQAIDAYLREGAG